MFGYVVVNKPELKFREFDVYRAYYCGLCHSLSKRHGLSGQLTLSYDMTFLVILLSSLYEPEHNVTSKRCVVHPLRRQNIISSEFTDYVADMNVILSYFKCLDDWHDDRSVLKLAYSKLLKKGSIGKNLNNVHATSDSTDDGSVAATQPSAVDDGSVAATQPNSDSNNQNSYFTDDSGHLHISPDYSYKNKIEAISSLLDELGTREKMNETNVDVVAGLFGKIMQILFVPFDDIYAKGLGRMGFYLGKFIYIMDAFDDVEEDVKKGRYNVFSNCYTDPDFETHVKDMLTMMMAECSDAFEMLPAVDNADILRNILYSGVWNSYERRVSKNLENK
ncbi:DUF5685 family protein [Eubacterium sp. AF17-7]|jgi:hypothetical protein|uniref:DUF5685 family protein n=1 Tax=Eubacterium TaxID=1730 RepID=UPI000E4B35FB|nr:DUF5685 family protein [Eubacterium sp. AF17-7]RGG64032.1 hypothetical protein DWW96_10070 [Eubacterium sp. AF17-7]